MALLYRRRQLEVLDQLTAFRPPPIEALTPEAARNLPTIADAALAVIGSHFTKRAVPFPLPVGRIDHRYIDTPEGGLLLRLYYPLDRVETPPILVYFHDGGWVVGNLNASDSSCRALCAGSGFIVASVAYRQAPEHPFPAAPRDAFHAFQWIRENARTLEGDPRCIAIGGEGAGANLATVTCIRAKNEKLGQPIHQLLIYPVTQFGFETQSYDEHQNARPLDSSMMRWFWGHYLESELEGANSYASPFLTEDLSGVPSATVITAEIDPLRSEGEAYGRKLRGHGCSVRMRRFFGVAHEFFGLSALLPEAAEAVEMACSGLRAAAERAVPQLEKDYLLKGDQKLRYG